MLRLRSKWSGLPNRTLAEFYWVVWDAYKTLKYQRGQRVAYTLR